MELTLVFERHPFLLHKPVVCPETRAVKCTELFHTLWFFFFFFLSYMDQIAATIWDVLSVDWPVIFMMRYQSKHRVKLREGFTVWKDGWLSFVDESCKRF